MHIEEFRAYCLSKNRVTEEFPFDENTLVFKVYGKMFALTGLEEPDLKVNLKCDPEKAISLREHYKSITAGFHMNKKHWNTVEVDGSFSDDFFKDLIDHSYDLVVKGLPKKLRDQLL
ncbi:MmcQ/YjbR family DNA-binding protein [Lutimonas vermicola]|uniref:MmcQ/YjbR family DNA-binding protein n=1 Tax=Lutimonas vermicola TaxID=414288 RepID=A0ABU9L3W6_9FLAO